MLETKENLLKKIQLLRFKLNKEIENGLISEDDIISVIKGNINYIFCKDKKVQSYKQKVLKDIYNCPFLLCDQNNVSLKIKKLLPLFLNMRYLKEIEEIEYLLKSSYINNKEYEELISITKFTYFESSIDGKNILENGQVDNVISNEFKFKIK